MTKWSSGPVLFVIFSLAVDKPEEDPETKRQAMLANEARAMLAMKGHPGFAELYGIVNRNPPDAIIMEFVGDHLTYETYTLFDIEFKFGLRMRKVDVVRVSVNNALLLFNHNTSVLNFTFLLNNSDGER